MEQNELYEAMFKRKSVRKFEAAPLDDATIADIRSFTSGLRCMFPNIRTELRFLKEEEVRGMIKVKAPQFLAIYSEEKEGYLANAGFILQQVDLFLSSKDIGSCWQGVAKPSKDLKTASDLEFVILMAYGRAAEDVHRRSVSEFKRGPLEKITDLKGDDDILEAARIAPSGMNNQPWFFTGSGNKMHAYSSRSLMVGDTNKISVGIALCHLWLAAQHAGKVVEFIDDPAGKENPPKGTSYIASAIIS